MRIIRVLAAAAVFAGGALGFAGPAQADPQILQGSYTYTQDDGFTGTWNIYPSCVPTVGDLREPLFLPVGCRLHVEAIPTQSIRGGTAYQTNGEWSYTTDTKDGMQCPDGSSAPIHETYTFNTDTMTGARSVFHNEDCGLQPGMIRTPFTLAFKAPLPLPVEQQPLQCEPNYLRVCS